MVAATTIMYSITLLIIILIMSLSGNILESKLVPNPRKDIHTLPKTLNHDYKIVRTHLIDGIFEGFVNASYQRDGFGILQTDEFQTYMGYFKYNKPHGLGLIIYSDGSTIYANFKNGQMEGIGLSDNGVQLQVGTFHGTSLMGMGFEYFSNNGMWKMNSYHKGVPIELVKEEKMPIEEGIPNILTLQSEILSHYLNYTQKRYFSKVDVTQVHDFKEDINSFYVHKLNDETYFFGCMINNVFDGLGVIYNVKSSKVQEVGTYQQGNFNGYGLKIDNKSHSQEQGFFLDGKKQGIFIVNQAGKRLFMEYKKGKLVMQARGETVQAFKKNQKIYYYRQKDFLSTRNNLNLSGLRVVFESSEYKAWKIQEQADKREKRQKTQQNKPTIEGKNKSKPAPSMVFQGLQKSSVQIMKQKIIGMMTHKQSKKNKNDRSMLFQKQNEDTSLASYEKQHEDDEIAAEESPIQMTTIGNWPQKRSVTFQSNEKVFR